MTKEEIELLHTLLDKAAIESHLIIYDGNEDNYDIDWCFIDNDKVCIMLEKI